MNFDCIIICINLVYLFKNFCQVSRLDTFLSRLDTFLSNVERNENDAREKVREESTHVASLVPIGSPVAMMEETRHVLTTKPAMLNDRKPVMLSGKMAMTPQPAGADLSGHFAAPSGSRVGRRGMGGVISSFLLATIKEL